MEKKLANDSNPNKQQLEWVKKKPFQKITNNLSLKIVAVVIAIISWASVQASSDGIKDQRFDIPITYINAQYLDQNNFSLKDYPESITIEVKARASALVNMRAYHFTATADLSTRMGDDTYRKLVQVQVTPHKDIVDDITDLSYKTSEWVSITLEPIQTKMFKVEVVTEDELPEGYQIGSEGFLVEPSSVVIRAPESSFSSINKVIVHVSLGRIEDVFINQKVEPVILDSNGKVILKNDKITVDTDSIKVTTELLKSKKIPVIVDGTSGTLADGYLLKDTTTEPKEIVILGTRADLLNVNSVTIPKEELNINGLTANKEFAVDITKYLPETVSLYGEESAIRVVVSVEALEEKSYSVPIDQIEMQGMSDEFHYKINTKNLVVILRGLEEDLESLKPEEIELWADVSELDLGMNSKVPVEVRVKSGFTIMNTPTITVRVTEKEESSTESSEESSTTESAVEEEIRRI